MNNRELLEQAAKAAGIEAKNGELYVYHNGFGWNWNPLTDDGDALRLAVKLDIDVLTQDADLKVGALYPTKDGSAEVWEGVNDDPYAATRRAIVRAAAEIAKETK